MALTITNVDNSGLLNKRVVFCDIAFDDSYPTGGEAFVANTLGMLSFDMVIIEPSAGYTFSFDRTNNKILAYAPVSVVAGDGSADANNTIMKSATATLEVGGTGTAFQLAAAEVLDTTDLSGVTGVKLMAIGV